MILVFLALINNSLVLFLLAFTSSLLVTYLIGELLYLLLLSVDKVLTLTLRPHFLIDLSDLVLKLIIRIT